MIRYNLPRSRMGDSFCGAHLIGPEFGLGRYENYLFLTEDRDATREELVRAIRSSAECTGTKPEEWTPLFPAGKNIAFSRMTTKELLEETP